jgi:hypothetical protein
MSRFRQLLWLCAFVFALCIGAGVKFAWAVAGGCSGTVVNDPDHAGQYVLGCAGDCSPNAGPCKPTGQSGQGAQGAVMCECGNPPSMPANGPCNMFLNWVTRPTGKKFSVTCWNNDCSGTPPVCEPEGHGITIDSETGYLSGSGSVTCPCP